MGASLNNFELNDDSPALDKGHPVALIPSFDSSTGTTVHVEAATGFHAMRTWGHEWIVLSGAATDLASDIVLIGAGPPVRIVEIDYEEHTLTLEESRVRNVADPVYYCFREQCLSGAKPDLGAFEKNSIPINFSDGVVEFDGGDQVHSTNGQGDDDYVRQSS